MDKDIRLQRLINYYCSGNKSQFAQKIGITPQNLSNWIAKKFIDYDRIFTNCENLSAKWLLTGEGEMLESAPKKSSEDSKTISELLDRIERLVAENAVLKYQLKEKNELR